MQPVFRQMLSVHLPFTGRPASLVLPKSGPNGVLKVGMRMPPAQVGKQGRGHSCYVEVSLHAGLTLLPDRSRRPTGDVQFSTPQLYRPVLGRVVLPATSGTFCSRASGVIGSGNRTSRSIRSYVRPLPTAPASQRTGNRGQEREVRR